MANRRFLILFATTITLVVVTIRVAQSASSGGALVTAGLLLSGALAALGILILVRSVHVDSRRRTQSGSGRRA